MVASIVTLKKGVSYVPRYIEGRCHVSAVVVAVIMTIGGLVKCVRTRMRTHARAHIRRYNYHRHPLPRTPTSTATHLLVLSL